MRRRRRRRLPEASAPRAAATAHNNAIGDASQWRGRAHRGGGQNLNPSRMQQSAAGRRGRPQRLPQPLMRRHLLRTAAAVALGAVQSSDSSSLEAFGGFAFTNTCEHALNGTMNCSVVNTTYGEPVSPHCFGTIQAEKCRPDEAVCCDVVTRKRRRMVTAHVQRQQSRKASDILGPSPQSRCM